LAGSVTSTTDDVIVLGTGATTATHSYAYEIEGLATPMITTGTYQNVNVGNYATFAAQVRTNSGTNRTLNGTLMQQVIDDIDDESDGRVDLIVAATSMRQPYLDLVLSDKRYASGKNLDAGYEGELYFNKIPIMFTKRCQYNWIYFLDTSTWLVCEQGNVHWFEDDGSILSRVGDSDAVEGLLRYYMNLRCELPAANGVLKDITVTLST
jgi:hypothetical protein